MRHTRVTECSECELCRTRDITLRVRSHSRYVTYVTLVTYRRVTRRIQRILVRASSHAHPLTRRHRAHIDLFTLDVTRVNQSCHK